MCPEEHLGIGTNLAEAISLWETWGQLALQRAEPGAELQRADLERGVLQGQLVTHQALPSAGHPCLNEATARGSGREAPAFAEGGAPLPCVLWDRSLGANSEG